MLFRSEEGWCGSPSPASTQQSTATSANRKAERRTPQSGETSSVCARMLRSMPTHALGLRRRKCPTRNRSHHPLPPNNGRAALPPSLTFSSRSMRCATAPTAACSIGSRPAAGSGPGGSASAPSRAAAAESAGDRCSRSFFRPVLSRPCDGSKAAALGRPNRPLRHWASLLKRRQQGLEYPQHNR